MAQSHTSVARAVFTTGLLRSEPGVADISRDDATLFARTLLKTCNVCSTSNIKLCKSLIVTNILASSARTEALAKYLVTLSRSFCPRDSAARVDTTKPGDENEGLGKIVNGKVQQPPDPAFKRLHILYIVHDVLSYAHSHTTDSRRDRHAQISQKILQQLQPSVCVLAELAACHSGSKAGNVCSIVLDVLSFWRKNQIFTSGQLDEMREKVSAADGLEWDTLLNRLTSDEQEQKSQIEDGTKWVLPVRHGVNSDSTAPWHELPAANGLYLKRTRGYPLRIIALPQGGFRLRGGGSEADLQLRQDVSNIYKEVTRCYDKYTNADEVQDIDALGNIVWKDPDRPTRNHWGFTLDGINKRKQLAEHFAGSGTGYDDFGRPVESGARVNDAVERARALAAERGRTMGRGRGPGPGPGRAGWRGGRGGRGGRRW